MHSESPSSPITGFIIGVIVFAGITISVIVAKSTADWQEYRYQRELKSILDNCTTSLQTDLETIETALHSIRFFFNASTEVTREEFSTFTHLFLASCNGLNTLGWIPRVSRHDYTAFRRRYYSMDSTQTISFTGHPDASQPFLYPIAFLEPYDRPYDGTAIDISSIVPSITPDTSARSPDISVTLQTPNRLFPQSVDVLILLPVPRSWQQTSLDTAFAPPPASYAVGIITVDEMLSTIIQRFDLEHINLSLELFDDTIADSGPPFSAYQHLCDTTSFSSAASMRHHYSRTIIFGNTRWHLSVSPTPKFIQYSRLFHPLLILCYGITITVLVVFNLIFLVRKNTRIQFLVNQRTSELAASEYRLSIIADNIKEGFWLYSVKEDLFTYVSSGLMKIMGDYGKNIVNGTFATSLMSVHPDDVAMVRSIKRSSIQEKKPFNLEYRLYEKNGKVQWIAEYANPLSDVSNTMMLFAGVCSDITERKAAEAEKKELEDRFLQAQRAEATGQLAGCIAHDFNNLLSPVIAFSEMLKEDLASNTQVIEYVNHILGAGFRARDLVRQLLAFSRKQTLDYTVVDFDTVIKNFEKLLRKSIRENITLTLIFSPESKRISADVGQIEQVLMNIVVNAADAMPDGGILTIETLTSVLDETTLSMKMDVKPNNYATCIITDTGTGMDSETCDRIFEPFYSTKGSKGTGLGLASVYGIIKQHNGNISVYSEPGKGTSFKIYLPLTDNNLLPKLDSDHLYPHRNHPDITILIVDDNIETRRLVTTILQREHYTTYTTNGPQEALSLITAKSLQIHLLITDVIMPEMNGVQLYKKIELLQPGLRVLYMSGYPESVALNLDPSITTIRYIQKPFSMYDLLETVHAMTA